MPTLNGKRQLADKIMIL